METPPPPRPATPRLPPDELAKAKQMPATVQVGKAGITPGTVDEIVKQLKKRGMVKVRLLRSFREAEGAEQHDKRAVAEALAHRTAAQLVLVMGFAVVLRRDKAPAQKEEQRAPKGRYPRLRKSGKRKGL